MKTYKTILVFLLMYISCNLSAQSESKIWIDGYIFSEINGHQKAIPFATISFYDTPEHDNLIYFTVCGPFGNYRIKPYEYTKEFYATVECPGYRTRNFHIKQMPDKWDDGTPLTGNVEINIKLNQISTSTNIISRKVKNTNDTIKNLLQFLQTLPNIIYKEGNLVTKQEESVCLLINGYFINGNLVQELDQIPVNAVSYIECYTLPEESIYRTAVNVILTVGTQASWPEYKKRETSLVE